MNDVKASLEISSMIQEENKEDISVDHYFNVIQNKEKQGATFFEIMKDYIELEKKSFISLWKNAFFIDIEKYIHNKGFLYASLFVLLLCICRGLATQYLWKTGTFLSGALYPFVLYIMITFFTFPLYVLNKKYEGTEIKDNSKLSKLPFIVKFILVIIYLIVFMAGIPMFLEFFYFDQIYGYSNYIITCDTFYLYFILGMYLLFILIWFYSKNGLYGYFKANLPHKVKRKTIRLAMILFLLSTILMCVHYDCITKNDIYEKTLFTTTHYNLNKDLKAVELKANHDGTLRVDIYVQKHAQKRKKFNILGSSVVISNLHKLEYPNGEEDFVSKIFFLRMPTDLTDYDTLYKELTYDYWKEYAKNLEENILHQKAVTD